MSQQNETCITITYRDGHTITRVGTDGVAVVAQHPDGAPPEALHVQIELDIQKEPVAIAMFGALLTQLEEIQGENFVAQILAHYAHETNRIIKREGKRDIAIFHARANPGNHHKKKRGDR
jgi:hypothetical protein